MFDIGEHNKMLVLDEADELLNKGFKDPTQVVLLSATLPLLYMVKICV
jgi:superfamily II DNA/RNA helicase